QCDTDTTTESSGLERSESVPDYRKNDPVSARRCGEHFQLPVLWRTRAEYQQQERHWRYLFSDSAWHDKDRGQLPPGCCRTKHVWRSMGQHRKQSRDLCFRPHLVLEQSAHSRKAKTFAKEPRGTQRLWAFLLGFQNAKQESAEKGSKRVRDDVVKTGIALRNVALNEFYKETE